MFGKDNATELVGQIVNIGLYMCINVFELKIIYFKTDDSLTAVFFENVRQVSTGFFGYFTMTTISYQDKDNKQCADGDTENVKLHFKTVFLFFHTMIYSLCRINVTDNHNNK